MKKQRYGKKRLTMEEMRLREYKDLTKKDKEKLKEEYEFAKMDLEEDEKKRLENLKEEYYIDISEKEKKQDKRLTKKLR